MHLNLHKEVGMWLFITPSTIKTPNHIVKFKLRIRDWELSRKIKVSYLSFLDLSFVFNDKFNVQLQTERYFFGNMNDDIFRKFCI